MARQNPGSALPLLDCTGRLALVETVRVNGVCSSWHKPASSLKRACMPDLQIKCQYRRHVQKQRTASMYVAWDVLE